jgi:hypothetical protein
LRFEELRESAGGDVARTARPEWHHDLDRSGRVRLRVGLAGRRAKRAGKQAGQPMPHAHVSPIPSHRGDCAKSVEVVRPTLLLFAEFRNPTPRIRHILDGYKWLDSVD